MIYGEKAMESKEIADLVRGGILLAIALLMGVVLYKFYTVFPRMGISIKEIYYFPIAVIGAISWLSYSGLRIVISILRRTG